MGTLVVMKGKKGISVSRWSFEGDEYGYADMVAYALPVAETVQFPEPSNYCEVVTGSNAAQFRRSGSTLKFKHGLDFRLVFAVLEEDTLRGKVEKAIDKFSFLERSNRIQAKVEIC